jgi:hypothetical protein
MAVASFAIQIPVDDAFPANPMPARAGAFDNTRRGDHYCSVKPKDKGPQHCKRCPREEHAAVIVYDGKYTWQGDTSKKKRPISWWRSAYRLRIVDVSRDAPGVVFLKPFLVFFADTGEGASVTNCLPDLAKQICEDFHLELTRVVWIEDRPDSNERFRVAMFHPVARLGQDLFYQVDWRSATPRELELITAQCT